MDIKFSRPLCKVIIAGCFSLLLVGCNKTAEEHFTQAEDYLKEDDNSAAIIELKNAIQKSPDLSDARTLLGRLYLEQGHFINATVQLEKALETSTDKNRVYPLLARALYSDGNYDKLFSLVETANVSENSDAFADLRGIAALAYLQKGDLDNARHNIELASEASLDAVYSKLSLAALNAQNDDYLSAMSTANELIKIVPNNPDVHLFLGHLYQNKGEFEQAAKAYTQAFELAPGANQYQFFITQAYLSDKKYSEAEKVIDELIAISPQHPVINGFKAQTRYVVSDFEAAFRHAELSIQNGSKNQFVVVIAGVSAFKLEKYEQANRHLRKIAKLAPKTHFIHKMYALTKIKLGYIDDALTILESVPLDTQIDSDFLSYSSLELSKIGKNDEALELIQRLSESELQTPGSTTTTGIIKLFNNDQSGVEDLKLAIKQVPDSEQANLTLALHYLKQNMVIEAEQSVDNWLKLSPDNLNAINLKATVELFKKDDVQAEQWLLKALTINPDYISSLSELAKLKARNKELTAAYDYAYKAKALSPLNPVVARLFIVLSNKTDSYEKSLKLVDQQYNSEPENVALIHQKALFEFSNKKYAEAISVLSGLPPTRRLPSTWALLADIYTANGDNDTAKVTYQAWLKQDSESPAPYIKLIQFNDKNSLDSEAIQLAVEARAKFTDEIFFPLAIAKLTAKSGELDKALSFIHSLGETVQQSLPFVDLQAAIYNSKLQYNNALPFYRKMYEANPTLQNAMKVAVTHQRNGETTQAITSLESAKDQVEDPNSAIDFKLAELYSSTSPKKAIEHFLAVINKYPENVPSLNNVAWLFLETKDFEKGCYYAEQAYSFASASTEVQDTLGLCYLKTSKYVQAEKLLSSAYNEKKENVDIALHYAEALIMNNNKEEAKVVLASIQTANPAIEKKIDELLSY
ncbi:XrtA/PEP-CTERM system TPR-repeat protein PrsT [Aliivibrio kagoshimensis]|uniref:XrtA/PEP-CTERM system TPR-repeat protein PrsT n=1 Tax=Aliivibrio kagoshimensis TaxID=2910230 RepID=UPI003D0D41CB